MTLKGTLPTDCTASVWNSTPRSWQSWPISRTGCSTPISLLAPMIETRIVLSSMARFEIVEIDQAVLLHGQVGDAEAVLLQPLAGIEHRLVLGRLGDDVVALLAVHLGHALDGQVVALGGAGGEDDLLGAGADQLGNLLARLFHRLLGHPAELVVAAGGIAEVLAEVRQHRFQHPRIHRRGGVVIHVDRQLHCRSFLVLCPPYLS